MSEENPREYKKDRSGPAKDGLWQVIMERGQISAAIDSRQKVVLYPATEKAVEDVIGTGVGHEIEGHVVQALNREKIPLKIMEKIGGGRSSLFAEMGAMKNEDVVRRDNFNSAYLSHTHYFRAIQKKEEGGSYKECAEAFYESARRELVWKKEEYAYLGGANMETIISLIKSGMLKRGDIQKPKGVAQKIWKKCITKYAGLYPQ